MLKERLFALGASGVMGRRNKRRTTRTALSITRATGGCNTFALNAFGVLILRATHGRRYMHKQQPRQLFTAGVKQMNTQTEQSTKRMDEQRHYTYINDCGVWRVGHYEWSSIQFAHDGSWDEHYVFVTHTEFEHEHDESDAIALCNKLNGVGVWRDAKDVPEHTGFILIHHKNYNIPRSASYDPIQQCYLLNGFENLWDSMVIAWRELPPLPQPCAER